MSEISRRQDQFTRGTVTGYWFPLTYLAVTDKDGRLATLATSAASDGARLSTLLEYPELSQPLPSQVPLPEHFEQTFHEVGIVRIRRGPLSATLVLRRSERCSGLEDLLQPTHGDLFISRLVHEHGQLDSLRLRASDRDARFAVHQPAVHFRG